MTTPLRPRPAQSAHQRTPAGAGRSALTVRVSSAPRRPRGVSTASRSQSLAATHARRRRRRRRRRAGHPPPPSPSAPPRGRTPLPRPGPRPQPARPGAPPARPPRRTCTPGRAGAGRGADSTDARRRGRGAGCRGPQPCAVGADNAAHLHSRPAGPAPFRPGEGAGRAPAPEGAQPKGGLPARREVGRRRKGRARKSGGTQYCPAGRARGLQGLVPCRGRERVRNGEPRLASRKGR